jgi:hypothetical protein
VTYLASASRLTCCAFVEGSVALSEEGAVATQITEEGEVLEPLAGTGGVELAVVSPRASDAKV